MTTYILTPPRVKETPAAWDRFFVRIGIDRGITIAQRIDGTFYQVRYPSLDELNGLKNYWLGGHVHTISASDAAALTAAGYGAYITTLP